jgi:hypothetical protein
LIVKIWKSQTSKFRQDKCQLCNSAKRVKKRRRGEGERGRGGERVSFIHNGCAASRETLLRNSSQILVENSQERGREGEGEREFL